MVELCSFSTQNGIEADSGFLFFLGDYTRPKWSLEHHFKCTHHLLGRSFIKLALIKQNFPGFMESFCSWMPRPFRHTLSTTNSVAPSQFNRLGIQIHVSGGFSLFTADDIQVFLQVSNAKSGFFVSRQICQCISFLLPFSSLHTNTGRLKALLDWSHSQDCAIEKKSLLMMIYYILLISLYSRHTERYKEIKRILRKKKMHLVI